MSSKWAALGLAIALSLAGEPAARADEIVIDGTESPEEWAAAVEHPLEGGGTVLLSIDRDEIRVAFRGNEQGWAHVYVYDGKGIRVLHASAALGTAEYRREGNSWLVVRPFEWGMRNSSLDESAIIERQQHLASEGWVASTAHMGEKTFIEFRIDRELLGGGSGRLAFVFAASADRPNFWPSTLADDTLAEQLIFGNSPTPLEFDPATWATADR